MKRNIAPLAEVIVRPIIERAFEEDFGRGGDITSNSVIDTDKEVEVVMSARDSGIIAGLDIAELIFKMINPNIKITKIKNDGDEVFAKDEVMLISGNAISILTAERIALNFIGRMSGIASLTNKMVKAVGDHKTKILSTRKTTPTLRSIEKHAVMLGGGYAHRRGLDDAVMIKDNHIAIAGDIKTALRLAKKNIGHTVKIEIEVDNLKQLKIVLEDGADIIMLDNMSIEDMTEAIKMINGRSIVEASGNITLERITKIAAIGIDVISSGALTHSAPNFDIGLDFKA